MIPNEGLPKVAATFPASLIPVPQKIYAWCTCGLSEKQPFCDGSHKRIESTINEQGETVMPYKSLKLKHDDLNFWVYLLSLFGLIKSINYRIQYSLDV